jgi:hypothetical protein
VNGRIALEEHFALRETLDRQKIGRDNAAALFGLALVGGV